MELRMGDVEFVVGNAKIMGFYFGNKFIPVIYGNKILIWVTVFDSSYIYIYMACIYIPCLNVYLYIDMYICVRVKQ